MHLILFVLMISISYAKTSKGSFNILPLKQMVDHEFIFKP